MRGSKGWITKTQTKTDGLPNVGEIRYLDENGNILKFNIMKIWPLWHGHVYVRKTTLKTTSTLQIAIYSVDGIIVQWVAYFDK